MCLDLAVFGVGSKPWVAIRTCASKGMALFWHPIVCGVTCTWKTACVIWADKLYEKVWEIKVKLNCIKEL